MDVIWGAQFRQSWRQSLWCWRSIFSCCSPCTSSAGCSGRFFLHPNRLPRRPPLPRSRRYPRVEPKSADITPSPPASVAAPAVPAAQSRVFIVYGHDVQAREQLELLLRRLQLEPIVLQNIPGGGDTLIEKLEKLTGADFACVLLTPDDEGRKRDEAADLRPRARQNVVLELGMVLARLGRQRVAILVKGDDIERPSDINGLIYIPFSDHVNEAKNKLAANLQEAGFTIRVRDLQG